MREYTISGHHQSGTVKMGPATDPGAVVDPRLRVHGIKRLRVVDASIMPTVPSANINAPTIMVGEKVTLKCKLFELIMSFRQVIS